MTRAWPLGALVAGVLLAGCAVGLSGRDVFGADGVLVVLTVRGVAEPVAGELLTAADSAWTVDALGADGVPARVVRVRPADVVRGTVYPGQDAGRWAARGLAPPRGVRQIARIGPGGAVWGGPPVRLVSRFPHGMPDAARGALLARRGQPSVIDLPAR